MTRPAYGELDGRWDGTGHVEPCNFKVSMRAISPCQEASLHLEVHPRNEISLQSFFTIGLGRTCAVTHGLFRQRHPVLYRSPHPRAISQVRAMVHSRAQVRK